MKSTYLFNFLMIDFNAWKSGRSIGSSVQQRLITPASSSQGQSYSSRVGRNAGLRGFLTLSTISVSKRTILKRHNVQTASDHTGKFRKLQLLNQFFTDDT